MKTLLMLLLMALSISAYTQELVATSVSIGKPGEIHIRVGDLRNSMGHVVALLFNKQQGYPDASDLALHKLSVTIQNKTAHLQFSNLLAGKYVVSLFHDEDNNGKLNRNGFGAPAEGVGVSNNIPGNFGPPDYKKCQIEVTHGKTEIAIAMKYF